MRQIKVNIFAENLTRYLNLVIEKMRLGNIVHLDGRHIFLANTTESPTL